MINYIISSIKRKLARRITKKYSTRVDTFNLTEYKDVKFVNWENPLVEPVTLSQNTLDFFKQYIKEGDVVVDIGANIGHMSTVMSLIAGKSGVTLSFDPNPFVFEILVENSKLNLDKTNIHPYNFAISDTEDEFYYNSSEASFNNGGISKDKISVHGKFSLEKKVKSVRLEDFIINNFPNDIHKLSFIKIDTEGYDIEILKSIADLLKKYKPTVITECFGKNNENKRFTQFDILTTLGYTLYYFSDFSIETELIPINKREDMLKWKHFDILAISK
ncbi:MAG: FkbM family methyltransferase [Cytophagaceae bacterium]|jgi:FkbM family methyltransferase|nr:FkbM family methyltransferase [Cytophagaceae bacterium]